MIQNICLIIPPSLFLLDERVFMSLGILKVAAVLEQEGVTVELLDLSGVTNYEEALAAHIQQSRVGMLRHYGHHPANAGRNEHSRNNPAPPTIGTNYFRRPACHACLCRCET